MKTNTAIQHFLNDVRARNLSPRTYERYHHDLTEFHSFTLTQESTYLTQLNADTIRTFLAHLHQRDNYRKNGRLSPYSVEGKYRTLKTFLTFCHIEGIIKTNPMRHIRKPKLPKRTIPRLDEDQVIILLTAIQQTRSPKRNHAIILLMVLNGLRRGEVLTLKIEDVNLQKRRAHVRGKGQKERFIPLGHHTTRAIKNYLVVRPPSPSCQLFLTEIGKPIKADAIRSLLNRTKHRLKWQRLYPHLLRHSFANLYLKCHRDFKSLQQILGHSKASTTLDLYTDFDIDDIQEIYESKPIINLKKLRR